MCKKKLKTTEIKPNISKKFISPQVFLKFIQKP